MAHKHKVRTFLWVEEYNSFSLESFDQFFETLEEATRYADAQQDHLIKIYDDLDRIVYSKNKHLGVPPGSYV